MKKLVVVGLALLLSSVAPGAAEAQVQCYSSPNQGLPSVAGQGILLAPASQIIRNVKYCRAGGVDLRLDVLFPQTSHGRTPAIVFVHGGGFVTGDREQMHLLMQHAATRGYLTVSVDYRLAITPNYNGVEPIADEYQRDASVLEAIQDVNCAFRWVRVNAASLNVDPTRVAGFGASAGAHLALMNAYAGDVAGFKGLSDLTLAARTQRSAANLVVNWFGPTNLTSMVQSTMGIINPNHNGACEPVVPAVMDCSPQSCPAQYAAWSPVSWVRQSSPPTLTVHGTADTVVPYAQAVELWSVSTAVGHPHGIIPITGAQHGFAVPGDVVGTAASFAYAITQSFSVLDAYLHP